MRTNALSEAVSRSFGPSTIVLRVLLHEITPPQRHLLYENSFLSFSSINLHGFRLTIMMKGVQFRERAHLLSG